MYKTEISTSINNIYFSLKRRMQQEAYQQWPYQQAPSQQWPYQQAYSPKPVIDMEPSPELEQIKQLGGEPFYDQSFPPTQQSLTGEYGQDPDWSNVTWVRITEKMNNPYLFQQKIQAADIKQGALGNCYFLAGLAALAEKSDRIFSIFLVQEMNASRYFAVKILFRGMWRRMILDEYIPWFGTRPAFSRTNEDQLWVVLLQKAWAKLYTSYKRTEGGQACQPLHDLTGAPTRRINLKSKSFNFDKEWQYLVESSRREYAMIAGSNSGQDTQRSPMEVIKGHAYTLLNARTIIVDYKQYRVVKLRNPHAQSQPKGKWNDNDPIWEKISPQQKQIIGYKNCNDGFFFMDYDQFVQEFSSITVAEVDDKASYVYKYTKDPQLNGVFFTIDIFENGLYYFQVDKPPFRIYKKQARDLYNYPTAQFTIGRIQEDSISKFKSCYQKSISCRTLWDKFELAPGRYVTFVKINFDKKFEDQYYVTLAVYSLNPCAIRFSSYEQEAIFNTKPSVYDAETYQGRQYSFSYQEKTGALGTQNEAWSNSNW